MNDENSVGLTVRKLNSAIRRDIERTNSLKGVNAKGVHGWAIKYFHDNRDKDIYQRDFEEKFAIRRSTATQFLKTMERNGLIKRESVDSDARLKKIILTDRAEDILKFIEDDIKKREKLMREGISEKELNTFFNVSKKIISNLEDRND